MPDIGSSFRSLDPSSELGVRAEQSRFFHQAKEKARRVNLGGKDFYLLEGDLLLDEVELAEYALRKDAGEDGPPVADREIGGKPAKLLGMARDGRMVRWKPGKVLSYYVAQETFPAADQYRLVRENVRTATEEWMGACGIQFEYRGGLDADPGRRPDGALFSVVYQDVRGRFIAAAFFPDAPPARRLLVIDPSYFKPDLRYDKVGVLRHELGHVLGFRHEMIRSEAPAGCPGEALFGTIDLTKYDPHSVMHYFCGGVGSTDLEITDLDREGARRLYGLPLASYSFVE